MPGAVRTRLALLGARLPPGAAKAAERASAAAAPVADRRAGAPARRAARESPSASRPARRPGGGISWRAPWNPLRALGPRLHPVVHVADEEARDPCAGGGRPAAAEGPEGPLARRASASTPARRLGEDGSAASITPSASGWCCRRATACRRSSTRSRPLNGQPAARGRRCSVARAPRLLLAPRLGARRPLDVARIERARVAEGGRRVPARGPDHGHRGGLAAQRRRPRTTTSPRRTTGGPTRSTPAVRTSSATASATRTTSTSTGAPCVG